ncbi:sensor histidine kinase [Virgibacillus sediminis]|uniref:sensor histidine kinase n=1 Tax=Virgibacillus sediminis TaxID=202260 RepID=UPI0036F1C38D
MQLLELVSNSNTYGEEYETDRSTKELFALLIEGVELNGQVFSVIDDEGRKVFSTENHSINAKTLMENIQERKVTSENKGSVPLSNNDKYASVSYYQDSSLDYYYILFTPKENKNVFLTKELIIILIAVGVISVFSIIMISFHLTRPIRRLSKDMTKKNISFSDEVIMKDEIWAISIQLNKVFHELKEQIDKGYQLEIRKNKAQFLALQSQINPHFLYNTLGTINSIALVENVPLIAKITKSLSEMFRYNSLQDKESVLLKEELSHIQNYLQVQLIRFDGMIKEETKIEKAILECKTIKFMLQPIIENCFEHAFKDIEGQGVIRIVGYRKGETVIITVEDNGPGIKTERLNEMNELFKEASPSIEKEQSNGIGLLNINTRIKLAFGEEYGLSFHSLQPRGLRVKITLPFVREDGDLNVTTYDN